MKKINNPIFALQNFIPDTEAHVFSDGKAYFYGSLDNRNDFWCSDKYKVFSSEKMDEVTDYGVSFQLNAKKQPNQKYLYAPDCVEKDGVFYLYYCCDDGSEWVAQSDKPYGLFAKETQIKGIFGIDPAVFIDDDGAVYYYWGQLSLNGCRLKDNMSEIDADTVKTNLITQDEHFFHEGSSMRKRNGIYYLVFADVSRGYNEKYGGVPTCLGYCTSTNPLGPFTYRGVIVDNALCDPMSWNNHGSIECIDGQWYVFYHRSTGGNSYMRRACAEKIEFDENGLIKEVKMTSSGAADYLENFEKGAEVFCEFHGSCFIDADVQGNTLTQISDGDRAVIRYVKLSFGDKITAKFTGNGEITLDFVCGQKTYSCKRLSIDNGTCVFETAYGGIGELIFKFGNPDGLKISEVKCEGQ